MTKHRGPGINLGGTSTVNEWKMKITGISEGAARPVFEPLRRWPAVPHPEQSRLDAFKYLPSIYK